MLLSFYTVLLHLTLGNSSHYVIMHYSSLREELGEISMNDKYNQIQPMTTNDNWWQLEIDNFIEKSKKTQQELPAYQ